jgi:tetratricopeptide (TPR) repeat protein
MTGGQLDRGDSQSDRAGGFALSRTGVCALALFSAAAVLAGTAPSAFSQDAPPPPKQQDQPKPNTDNATQSAPDQPKWDPLRADKDIEVGKYYMNKGDVDAAIDRFMDAIDAKPGFAIPFRYLGEAYEKKGQKKPAVKAYQRYLDLYPKAEDGEKIRKKIEKLHKEIDKEKESG